MHIRIEMLEYVEAIADSGSRDAAFREKQEGNNIKTERIVPRHDVSGLISPGKY